MRRFYVVFALLAGLGCSKESESGARVSSAMGSSNAGEIAFESDLSGGMPIDAETTPIELGAGTATESADGQGMASDDAGGAALNADGQPAFNDGRQGNGGIQVTNDGFDAAGVEEREPLGGAFGGTRVQDESGLEDGLGAGTEAVGMAVGPGGAAPGPTAAGHVVVEDVGGIPGVLDDAYSLGGTAVSGGVSDASMSAGTEDDVPAVDLCLVDNGGCAHTCASIDGAVRCSCNQGYTLEIDGLGCRDIDECVNGNGGCAQTCQNRPGTFRCDCASGYRLNSDGLGCDDIDECSGINCGPGGRCVQVEGEITAGAYTCECEPGRDGGGISTPCRERKCQLNQAVEDHVCVPCPVGTENHPGDDAALADTSCDPIICAQGEFVDHHVCTPCEPGSENEAGDNAALGNSFCDPIRCGLNELVVDHRCAPCLQGTQKSAGDLATGDNTHCEPIFLTVRPDGYDRALRNPMKGITTRGVRPHEWAQLSHVYIRWNELEDDESHGIARIRQVTEDKFGWVAQDNVKVIPRVYLHWSEAHQKFWPADMTIDDYSSPQFQARLTRLVSRLGQVWNDDPRVAFIEMGIFGKWGEQHRPSPEPEMQMLAAQAFAAAFPNKHVSVRHVWNEFQGYGFGSYWDSFSHYDQMWRHGQKVFLTNEEQDLYLTTYIGGETAYDWGGSETQPGANPTDSVRDPIHRNFIINNIRWLHCTQLRWIDDYDATDPQAQAGAEEIHRAMGYRFVLDEVGFTPNIIDNTLRVTAAVRNEGAAPFYYDWPLQVALLDSESRQPVWASTFESVDIRRWVGGAGWPSPDWLPLEGNWSQFVAPDHWSVEPLQWAAPPPTHHIDETFQVNVAEGEYVLALAILDPASGRPNLRFANSWYFQGGYHPVGRIVVGDGLGGPLPGDMAFDQLHTDRSINYLP